MKEYLNDWDVPDEEINTAALDDRINKFFYNKREIDTLLAGGTPGGGSFVDTITYDKDKADNQTWQEEQDDRLDALEAAGGSGYDDSALWDDQARQDGLITKNTTDIGSLTVKVNNNTTSIADKADANHNHNGVYWGMWTGTQAEYDAIPSKNNNTLYVVV